MAANQQSTTKEPGVAVLDALAPPETAVQTHENEAVVFPGPLDTDGALAAETVDVKLPWERESNLFGPDAEPKKESDAPTTKETAVPEEPTPKAEQTEPTAPEAERPEAAESAPPEKPSTEAKTAKGRAKPVKAEKAAKPEKPAPEKPAPDKPAATGKKQAKPAKEKPVPRSDKPKKTPVKDKPIEQPVTAPTEPEAVTPEAPREAPRTEEPEQIVFLKLDELHAFKNHPFQVRDDESMRAMVESVKAGGVNQPAIVRPRENGGYEIVCGHRRRKASELAGYADMPCIVRNYTDDEAVLKMVEDNFNQRAEILASERAKSLKMQLAAIKHQGRASGQVGPGEVGKRSNEIIAERNKMTVKQVQRYIRLDELVPDLLKMVDAKKIAFTPAVEMSYIKPKNQRYIAVAIEGQQSSPSLSQAQRMRELDQKGMLNGDVIDGVLLEQKKEVDKVILSSTELSQYFGKDKTPREMKDTILKLLEDWKGQQKDIPKPEKSTAQEK